MDRTRPFQPTEATLLGRNGRDWLLHPTVLSARHRGPPTGEGRAVHHADADPGENATTGDLLRYLGPTPA